MWAVAFAPDGLTLGSGGVDRFVRLWDIETGRMLKSLRGHTHDIRAIVFTPDGQTLATGSEDRTIRMWNPKTGEPTKLLFTRYDHNITSLSLSPDGLMLARGSHNKDIKIWEVTTGTELMTLLGKDQYDHHWTPCVAFSPDGLHLASGSDIGKIKIWEVLPSGEERVLHNGHWREVIDDDTTEFRGFFVEDEGGFQKPMEYWIGAMTFTPDGKTLITGSRDTTIKFFEMPQVSEIRTVRGHSGWVRSLAVSPDGKVLMSASDDQTINGASLQNPQGTHRSGALRGILSGRPATRQRIVGSNRQAVGGGRRTPGVSLLLLLSVLARRNPVALALLPQGFPGQPEDLGGFSPASLNPTENGQDMLPFELLPRQRE